MRNYYLLLIWIFAICILSGCYDKKELEEQAYVIGIGVDATDQPHVYNFTYQIANPEVGSSVSGISSEEPPQEIVSVQGRDFLTALDTANASIAKKMTLEQSRILVVSEKLASSKDFLHLMQTVPGIVELRMNAQLVVSKESAQDFLRDNKPKLESRPHKYYQYMLDRAKETGIIPDATLSRFFQITEGDADLVLTPYATTEKEDLKEFESEDEYLAGQLPIKGTNATEFMGSAVFKEGKMIAKLNGEETRYSLMLDNTLPAVDISATFEDPLSEGYLVSTTLRIVNTKIDVDYQKNKAANIDVDINLHLSVFAVPSMVDYANDKQNQQVLQRSLEKQMKEKAEKLIQKTQQEYKAEPFYWSLYIRKYFLTIKDYEKADWNKKIYPNANIRVSVHIDGLEFGKTLRSSDIEDVRD